MNKTHISLIAALIVLLAGCGLRGIPGNGHIKTEQRAIGAFAQIQADGAFDIEWHSGAPALSIATDGNLLQYIDNEITGDRLRIHSTKRLVPSHSIKVVISSAVLN